MGIPVVSHSLRLRLKWEPFIFREAREMREEREGRSRAEEASCRDERWANVAAVLRRGGSNGKSTAGRLARDSPIFSQNTRVSSRWEKRTELGKNRTRVMDDSGRFTVIPRFFAKRVDGEINCELMGSKVRNDKNPKKSPLFKRFSSKFV